MGMCLYVGLTGAACESTTAKSSGMKSNGYTRLDTPSSAARLSKKRFRRIRSMKDRSKRRQRAESSLRELVFFWGGGGSEIWKYLKVSFMVC